jgi:hypothetical protein
LGQGKLITSNTAVSQHPSMIRQNGKSIEQSTHQLMRTANFVHTQVSLAVPFPLSRSLSDEDLMTVTSYEF